MKKVLWTLGIGLLMTLVSSCSNDKTPSGASGAASNSNSKSADIFATVYFTNTPAPFTGGIVTLDGANPVTLTFPSGGHSVADVRLYQSIPNGSHSIGYSDSYGTTIVCAVNLNGVPDVTALSICYSFNSPVMTSHSSCGYSIYYSCP